MELDLQVSPEEIMKREVELGCESWTSFASSWSLNSSATDIVLVTLPSTAVELVQQLRSALVAGQWPGDTALTLPLFLAAVHSLSGLFRAVFAVEPSLFRPLPSLS